MREYRSSSPAAWNRFFPLSGIAIVLLLFGLSGGLIGLSGCKGFFVSQGSGSGGTGGSGGTTAVGDNFYVANGSNTYLAGLSVSSTGALAVLPNAPYNNGVAATSLAITPDNNYLYVATANGIYEYAISSNGSIAVQNNGQPLAQDVIATTLKVDSTGNYLLAAGLGTATGTPAIGIYQIGSGGGITAESGSPLALDSGPAGSTPSATLATGMLITPNNAYVYVSLGDLGVQVLTLGSGGALSTGSAPTILSPFSKSSSPSDYGLASDPNSKYLFVSELNTGLRVLSIGTGGGLNEILRISVYHRDRSQGCDRGPYGLLCLCHELWEQQHYRLLSQHDLRTAHGDFGVSLRFRRAGARRDGQRQHQEIHGRHQLRLQRKQRQQRSANLQLLHHDPRRFGGGGHGLYRHGPHQSTSCRSDIRFNACDLEQISHTPSLREDDGEVANSRLLSGNDRKKSKGKCPTQAQKPGLNGPPTC